MRIDEIAILKLNKNKGWRWDIQEFNHSHNRRKVGSIENFDVIIKDSKNGIWVALYSKSIKHYAGFAFLSFINSGIFKAIGLYFYPEFRGQDLSVLLYTFILKHHIAEVLISDGMQTKGSKTTWERLAKVPGILVYGWNESTQEAINLNSKDIGEDEKEIYNSYIDTILVATLR